MATRLNTRLASAGGPLPLLFRFFLSPSLRLTHTTHTWTHAQSHRKHTIMSAYARRHRHRPWMQATLAVQPVYFILSCRRGRQCGGIPPCSCTRSLGALSAPLATKGARAWTRAAACYRNHSSENTENMLDSTYGGRA